ncbi:hypothetical protein BOS5A_10193 [Bosea sp. EC-HK365B]|nr:hypothetical protein BOSE21B_10878 [Bosea sp. 21B]CAD5262716.1 hypothetical protein BOSE7B_150258 [Bosea sp. 7B]VVT43773.1 hypothetical protein BOS5A_10193 [Bosea sp. EC-HK365B]VXC35893.1 hypothetical protein BOSE127_180259 [Bosea sp. 127]
MVTSVVSGLHAALVNHLPTMLARRAPIKRRQRHPHPQGIQGKAALVRSVAMQQESGAGHQTGNWNPLFDPMPHQGAGHDGTHHRRQGGGGGTQGADRSRDRSAQGSRQARARPACRTRRRGPGQQGLCRLQGEACGRDRDELGRPSPADRDHGSNAARQDRRAQRR